MNNDTGREELGGYTLEILPDDDGWYGVLFDATGLDVWETEPLPDADSVRVAAQAVIDKAGGAR